MYAPGHVGIALLAYTPLAYRLERTGQWRARWIGAFAITVLGVWPDVDSSVGLAHRGVTHTVWAALLAGVTLALVAGASEPHHVRFGFTVGLVGSLSHLVGDVLTPMGIRPFAPFLTGDYTLSLVAAANPEANLALLVLGLVTFTLGVGRGRSHRVPVPVEPGT